MRSAAFDPGLTCPVVCITCVLMAFGGGSRRFQWVLASLHFSPYKERQGRALEPSRFALTKIHHRTWSFHVAVWQRTAKKCAKIQNAHAQTLFCSLNLLFGVAVAFVV